MDFYHYNVCLDYVTVKYCTVWQWILVSNISIMYYTHYTHVPEFHIFAAQLTVNLICTFVHEIVCELQKLLFMSQYLFLSCPTTTNTLKILISSYDVVNEYVEIITDNEVKWKMFVQSGWADKQPGHRVYWCSGGCSEWVSRRSVTVGHCRCWQYYLRTSTVHAVLLSCSTEAGRFSRCGSLLLLFA